MTASLPEGTRFIGPEPGATATWLPGDAPVLRDITACVACGLCLPECPTFRLTGDETASPRGRIAAMRAVAEGRATVDATFRRFMDLCLGCRACEAICPSHVPFGRLIDPAKDQAGRQRPVPQRLIRHLALDVGLAHGWLITAATAAMPLVRPFLPGRLRRLTPRVQLRELARSLPRVTDPAGPSRGTVAILAGCIQDRWFRPVNRATISVLSRNGWRVVVSSAECCGALTAHYGRLAAARRMARQTATRFDILQANWIVVNSAGCSAFMKEYGDLVDRADVANRVRDLMEFLVEQGFEPPRRAPVAAVALHDPCHLLHAQGIREAPRTVLRSIPGLEIHEIPESARCCGSAGLYNIFEPTYADALMSEKAANIASTGCTTVVAANPGCAVQIAAGLAQRGYEAEVLHPAELLERAYSIES